MDTPISTQERKALTNVRFEDWEYPAKLGVGAKTIAGLVEKGLIEKFASPGGYDRVRITDLGKAALDAPVPKKPPRGPRLAMAKPMLQVMNHDITKRRL